MAFSHLLTCSAWTSLFEMHRRKCCYDKRRIWNLCVSPFYQPVQLPLARDGWQWLSTLDPRTLPLQAALLSTLPDTLLTLNFKHLVTFHQPDCVGGSQGCFWDTVYCFSLFLSFMKWICQNGKVAYNQFSLYNFKLPVTLMVSTYFTGCLIKMYVLT